MEHKPPSKRSYTVSSKKLQANRQNARRATGPRTARGKSHSRLNALKHGILASAAVNQMIEGIEERRMFDEMVDGLAQELMPVGWTEELLVQELAACHWSRRKLMQYEQDLAFERYHDGIIDEQQITDLNARKLTAELRPIYIFGRKVGNSGELREAAGLNIPTLPHPDRLAVIVRYRAALSRDRQRLIKELEQRQMKRHAAESKAEATGAEPAAASPPARGGIDPGAERRNRKRLFAPLPIDATVQVMREGMEAVKEQNDREACPSGRPERETRAKRAATRRTSAGLAEDSSCTPTLTDREACPSGRPERSEGPQQSAQSETYETSDREACPSGRPERSEGSQQSQDYETKPNPPRKPDTFSAEAERKNGSGRTPGDDG